MLLCASLLGNNTKSSERKRERESSDYYDNVVCFNTGYYCCGYDCLRTQIGNNETHSISFSIATLAPIPLQITLYNILHFLF